MLSCKSMSWHSMTLCTYFDGRCWNHCEHHTHFSEFNVSKQNRVSLPFIYHTQTHAIIETRRTCDSYLNRLLRLTIYRYWSISWFDLCVMAYFWLIHPNLDEYGHSVLKCKFNFEIRFRDSVRVFCLPEGPTHQEPGWPGPRYHRYFTKLGTVTF